MEITTTRLVETLLQFFTDEGDWAYVMGYEECGIVAADVARNDTPMGLKRIVIRLRCGTACSVIRMDGITPPGCWDVARLTPTGYWAGEKPRLLDTYQIFETFKRHAQS